VGRWIKVSCESAARNNLAIKNEHSRSAERVRRTNRRPHKQRCTARRFCYFRGVDRTSPSSGLLRTGLALKLSQMQLATRSYLRDRTNQAIGTKIGYAIAVGLFGAAGVFYWLHVLLESQRCFVGSKSVTGCFPLSEPSAHTACGRCDLRSPSGEVSKACAASVSELGQPLARGCRGCVYRKPYLS
jgi:hypothetical protein